MLLNCGVGEDSWESLRLQEINQSFLKEISPEYLLEGLMLKLKLQYFGYLMGRTDTLEKTLMLGKIEGRRRWGWQKVRWSDGITDSTDEFELNSGSWWWTGSPGVLQSLGSQRVRLTEWLNWSELCWLSLYLPSQEAGHVGPHRATPELNFRRD